MKLYTLLLVLAACGPVHSANGYWEGSCHSDPTGLDVASGDDYPDTLLLLDVVEAESGGLAADLSISSTGPYYPAEPATELFTAFASGTREGADISLTFEVEDDSIWAGVTGAYTGTIGQNRDLMGSLEVTMSGKTFLSGCTSARVEKP